MYLEYITEVIVWVDKVVSLPQQSGQCNEQSKVRTQMSGPKYLAVYSALRHVHVSPEKQWSYLPYTHDVIIGELPLEVNQ